LKTFKYRFSIIKKKTSRDPFVHSRKRPDYKNGPAEQPSARLETLHDDAAAGQPPARVPPLQLESHAAGEIADQSLASAIQPRGSARRRRLRRRLRGPNPHRVWRTSAVGLCAKVVVRLPRAGSEEDQVSLRLSFHD
jgi:hypothetical protein